MVKRSHRNEVLLLYLRFFNILMSRKNIKQEEGKVEYTLVPGSYINCIFPAAVVCAMVIVLHV